MDEHIHNVIDLLREAINTEDWELVSEAKNQLENTEFKEFEDTDYQGMKWTRLVDGYIECK